MDDAPLKECESVIPLQIPRIIHAVLVGDERKLPPMVENKLSKRSDLGRTILFERLSLLGHRRHLFNIQYMMYPSISHFPTSTFYQNQIIDAPYVKESGFEKLYLPSPMSGPYSFTEIAYGQEDLGKDRRKQRNQCGVEAVSTFLESLYKACLKSGHRSSIGVISPYSALVASICEKIGKKHDGKDGFAVSARTEDGLQGGEEDVKLVSTVVRVDTYARFYIL